MSTLTMSPATGSYPSMREIMDTAHRLDGKVLRTPVWRWQTGAIREAFGDETEVWLKLELFQKTGTFKVRGALNSMAALDEAARRRGVGFLHSRPHTPPTCSFRQPRHRSGLCRHGERRARKSRDAATRQPGTH
jgi:hypothetical protein